LHWDGKIMDDNTGPGREHVDRLILLVSGHDVVKLPSVPKLCDSTTASMTHEFVATSEEWGLQERIKDMCFDTTASKTEAIWKS